MSRGRWSTRIAFVLLAVSTGGCDRDAPTAPDPLANGDPAAGQVAFTESCGPCHATADGFDLAYFDFPAADIVRRGVAHVDSSTAGDIVAYVESLEVERHDPTVRPFQPVNRVLASDPQLWHELFGTSGWPDQVLTVEWLRDLDLRDVPVPLPFPLWSSEADESDWMPGAPLPPRVLDASGGAVRTALHAYHADPGESSLLALIETFRQVTGNGSEAESPLCYGSAGAHTEPRPCFEARRWVSSLAAAHLLREGTIRRVPYDVAQLWWDTGEAAVSLAFSEEGFGRVPAASWLYMSSIFAPDGFPGTTSGIVEESGYMGQFLQSLDRPRLAVLVTLRRLVSDGPLHDGRPLNAYRDMQLAALRSPGNLAPDVTEFGLRYLRGEQQAGRLPTGEDRELARGMVERALTRYGEAGAPVDPEQDARIRNLFEEILDGLSAG